jgi:hypothetical protein
LHAGGELPIQRRVVANTGIERDVDVTAARDEREVEPAIRDDIRAQHIDGSVGRWRLNGDVKNDGRRHGRGCVFDGSDGAERWAHQRYAEDGGHEQTDCDHTSSLRSPSTTKGRRSGYVSPRRSNKLTFPDVARPIGAARGAARRCAGAAQRTFRSETLGA